MSPEQIDALAQAWIALVLKPRDSVATDPHRWAFERVEQLTRNKPYVAWQLILAVLARDDSHHALENLSAGPFEDLLNEHGAKMIRLIQAEAQSNPTVAKLLGGVRQARMSKTVWTIIQAHADHDGWNQPR